MNAPVRRGLGALVAGVAALCIGAGTRVAYSTGESDAALLRFSWRARSVLIEECRRLTGDEREALPAHMRRERVCEGRVAPYRLRIEVDGERIVDELAHGAGVREDRPIYVFREVRVPPGEHRVRVWFERVREPFAGHEEDDDEPEEVPDGRGRRERESDDRRLSHGDRSREAAPRSLAFDGSPILDGGDIALVTYDAHRRRLELRRTVAAGGENGSGVGTEAGAAGAAGLTSGNESDTVRTLEEGKE